MIWFSMVAKGSGIIATLHSASLISPNKDRREEKVGGLCLSFAGGSSYLMNSNIIKC